MSTDLHSPQVRNEPREWSSYPAADDEINLADLVRSIWDGRWLIAGVAAITTVLGAGYAFVAPNKYETTLELQKLTQDELGAYEVLNALTSPLDPLDQTKRKKEPSQLGFVIDDEILMNKTIERLNTREELLDSIQQTKLIQPEEFTDRKEYEKALEATAFDYKITAPEDPKDKKKNQELRENWAIRYEGPQKPELVLETLDLALRDSVEHARLALVEDYERKKSVYQQNQAYTLEDLQLQLTNLYGDYDKKIQQRLATLRENAGIARSLGLKTSTIEAQNYTTASTVVTNIKTDNPLYLRGYEALEKEIEQITSRTNRENFVAERIALEAEIRKVEQDQTIIRNDRAFIQTPLVDADRFKAIRYSLTTAETKNAKKTPLILALSVVLGGMLGLFVLFFRNALKRS
jgi:LPS O-antigen subunit length determinant protein (WzzB/FepE family)